MSNHEDRLSDYNDVPARIADFRAKHPGGSLQPANPDVPYKIEQIGERFYIVVVAAAYRTPDDPRPGIGMAYEQWPGKTPYTRDSELQNAETSAWGRAIVAVLAADTKKGIASQEEVRNRQADNAPVQWDPAGQEALVKNWTVQINAADTSEALKNVGRRVLVAIMSRELSPASADLLKGLGATRKAEVEAAEAAAKAAAASPLGDALIGAVA